MNLRPSRHDLVWILALAALGVLLCAAAAHWTAAWPLFSLQPPDGGPADVAEALRADLHFTFFTIWAALLLAAPALALLPAVERSAAAWRAWRICWSAALLVFAAHFYWAVVVIFSNDWSRILHTARVSAPRLDTVFALWWLLDVALAWGRPHPARWVQVQRWGVHLLALLLFFMGAAREGELSLSRLLGWGMAFIVALGWLGAWHHQRRQRSLVTP